MEPPKKGHIGTNHFVPSRESNWGQKSIKSVVVSYVETFFITDITLYTR